jgi:hypothetical protein
LRHTCLGSEKTANVVLALHLKSYYDREHGIGTAQVGSILSYHPVVKEAGLIV